MSYDAVRILVATIIAQVSYLSFNSLQENIPTGKLRRSHSAAATSILCIRKKDGSLRLCVDYQTLNCLTIPNMYPLPLISQLLDKTRGRKWFTRLNLKNGYNLVRIAAGEEWKTVFRTESGLFEFTLIPFGLTNNPASCLEMIDTIFKDIERYIWYLDDILIYGSNAAAKHQVTVKIVLQQCVEHVLTVNLSKSAFYVKDIIFFMSVINDQEVKMHPSKLETISKWPIPTKKK